MFGGWCPCFGRRKMLDDMKKVPEECPVCLEEDSRQHYLQPCGHTVHDECLLGWIMTYSGKDTTPRCLLCQRPVEAFLVHDVLYPIREWTKKALATRFEERFMNGCFFYVFCEGQTHRFYVPPAFSVYGWKQNVIRLLVLSDMDYRVCMTFQEWVRSTDATRIMEGRKYRLLGSSIMFCKSTCVLGSSS